MTKPEMINHMMPLMKLPDTDYGRKETYPGNDWKANTVMEVKETGILKEVDDRKLSGMEYHEVVTCSKETSIHEAACLMGKENLTSLFVRNDDGNLIGYVTDITLRDQVITHRVEVDQPVTLIMEKNILTLDDHLSLTDALVQMIRNDSEYLVIKHREKVQGVASRNELAGSQSQSPINFIQSIRQINTVGDLKKKWDIVPGKVSRLLQEGINPEVANQMITTISDIIAQKVIGGIIKEMGPPPARFVFMVLGSEGRKEQTLRTDQDNAIIYEDKANEHREEVRAYFLAFAEKVSDHLHEIGFSYCTGGLMAKNPVWTHSLSHWQQNYERWMTTAIPETVINITTFFDCRYIYGDRYILDELRLFLNEKLQHPLDKFLYHMANHALQYEPPLTMFNSFKTYNLGSRKVINVKRAMAMIVDLVRVYSLKNRIFKTNTGERMKALKTKGVFTEKEYQELFQAYYYLMGLRLNQQAKQLVFEQTQADNTIEPEALTSIEKVTLKEVFKTIKRFQLKIKVSFTHSLFG